MGDTLKFKILWFLEILFLVEWWSGSDLLLYIDKEDCENHFGKEHAYLIMNHRYEVDWLIGWIFCERIGLLGVSVCMFYHTNWYTYGYD